MGSIRGAARARPITQLTAVRKKRYLTSVTSRRMRSKFRSHLRLFRIPRRQEIPRAIFQRLRTLPHPHLHRLFTPSCKSSPSASVSVYLSVSPSLPASFSSCENITERAKRAKQFQPIRKMNATTRLGNRRPPAQWRCLLINGLSKRRGIKSSSYKGGS